MMNALGAMLQSVFVAAGVAILLDPTSAVLAVAAVATVTVLAAIAATLIAPATGDRSSSHPVAELGRFIHLAQSDPSAPGHSRPRAPGRAAAAA